DIGGIFNPLGLASYETYRGGMGNRGSPLYNFLGTKYVLANKDQPPGDASFVPVFNGDPQIDVYLNTNALPRAQLIDRALLVHSGEEAWQAIHAAEFDPAKEVVIENGADLSSAENQSAGRALAFTSLPAARDRVELIARTDSPAYLVLSDVYYPGWAATIDDQPTTLYPANFAFRAVLVPPGEHRVAFTFEPTTWRIGLAISALTAVGLIVFGVIAWRRRRRRSLPDQAPIKSQ
ncbi:MAG TPA: YfhO family protein, partial [Anaerolineae bacterium]|nr:YfhO family protein [Anaerolineae bacterium]